MVCTFVKRYAEQIYYEFNMKREMAAPPGQLRSNYCEFLMCSKRRFHDICLNHNFHPHSVQELAVLLEFVHTQTEAKLPSACVGWY